MFKILTTGFWEAVARLILRNKIFILLAVITATVFFSMQWKHMRFTYTEANMLPDEHEVNLVYNDFLKVFGEEGNLIVLGVKDSSLFSVEQFNAWNKLAESFKTTKEVETVLRNLNEDDFESLRNKLVIDLLFSTGIRRMELINIKEKDIDINSRVAKVLGKRNKERLLPLLPETLRVLKKYLNLKSQEGYQNEFLLVTSKGNKIYETLVYRIINSYFSEVSAKVKCSPHILRHTFATELLNKGADLNSVKELLGHSSLASTQVYTHNNLEQLKQVFNKAHPRSLKKD